MGYPVKNNSSLFCKELDCRFLFYCSRIFRFNSPCFCLELVVPEDLPADIKSKLIIILVNLKAKHLTNDLLDTFLEADPEDFGDLMLDISEALAKNKEYESALLFLRKLVDSERLESLLF